MSHVVSFTTDRFDPANEPANESNPIAGHAVLVWLSEQLTAEGYSVSEPATEDWGWYVTAKTADANYLIGASGEPPDAGRDVAWVIQIEKHRSLKDKLFGRNKQAADDAAARLVEKAVRRELDFRDVSVDRGP